MAALASTKLAYAHVSPLYLLSLLMVDGYACCRDEPAFDVTGDDEGEKDVFDAAIFSGTFVPWRDSKLTRLLQVVSALSMLTLA